MAIRAKLFFSNVKIVIHPQAHLPRLKPLKTEVYTHISQRSRGREKFYFYVLFSEMSVS